jgi:excisionase family DNA binding protein
MVSAIPFVERVSCTVSEACTATGIGRSKLYQLIGDGRIQSMLVGRRRLILVRSLLSLIQQTTQDAQ